MTYREALNTYVKNKECVDFLERQLQDHILDDEMVEYEQNILSSLFTHILYINTYTLYSHIHDAFSYDQIQHIATNIKNNDINYIYEWKSIPEWIESTRNKKFKNHFLFLYDRIISELKGITQKTFTKFKSHNLATAVAYLSATAYKTLKHQMIWGGENADKLDYAGVKEYFETNIEPIFNFIIVNNRDMNDFDD